MDFSRRGFIGFLAALSGGTLAGGKIPVTAAAETPTPLPAPVIPTSSPLAEPGAKLRDALRTRLGDDIFMSWFHALEFESFDGETVTVSVPVKFLRTWIANHYAEDLLECCRAEFPRAKRVSAVLRQPGRSSQAQLRREFEKMRHIADA